MSAPHLAFLDALDWSSPDRVDDDGRRYFELSVPHRHPDAWFVIPGARTTKRSRAELMRAISEGKALDLTELAAELGIEVRAFEDDGDGIVVDPNATGDSGNADEEELHRELVSGIASSTSKDFFGTEMSLRALQLMALQMQQGRPYLPQHNHGLSGPVEWHEVIGRTVHAEVVPVEGDQIAKPHNPSESQYILRATMQIIPVPAEHAERDESERYAASLLKRLAREEVIGQSIGGWFTRLQVVQNDEGEVERVIVQGVDLDHLAVTRAPANPDAVGIVRLRSAIERSAYAARAEQLIGHMAAGRAVSIARGAFSRWLAAEAGERIPSLVDGGKLEERHVVSVVDNEDGTVSMRFVVSQSDDDEARGGGHGDEDDDDMGRSEYEGDDDDGSTASGGEAPDTRNIDEIGDEADDENLRSAAAAILGGDHGEEAQRALRVATGDEDLLEDDLDGPADLDETDRTVQDRGVTDARRSAPTDTPSPAGQNAGTSEEPTMPELSLDAIRSLFKEELEPVIDRVAALEGGGDRSTGGDGGGSADQPDPDTVEGRLAIAEARAAAAVQRAETAERALGDIVSQPHRVGRATLSIPSGPAAAGAYGGLIERAREDAPQFAALVQRALPVLTGEDLTGNSQSQRAKLEDVLRAGLIAAENDGLITDPNIRAGWQ